MPLKRTPPRKRHDSEAPDLPASVSTDRRPNESIAGIMETDDRATRVAGGREKRAASSPIEDVRVKDCRVSHEDSPDSSADVQSEAEKEVQCDKEGEPDDTGFITVHRHKRSQAPKVVVTRQEAVIFSAGGEELQNNFNKVCDYIVGHVKGKIEEPRFTKTGELVIVVDAEEDRGTLLSLQELAGVKVSARISGGRSSVKGKISGVHPSISEATILSALRSLGVTEVARVKTKNPMTNVVSATEHVILTFTGNHFPSEIRLGLKKHGVVLYCDPMQCFRCYSMDHFAADCKVPKPKCRRCGSLEHLRRDCKAQAKCCLCSGEHEATWGSCPVRLSRIEMLKRGFRNVIQRQPEAPTLPLCAPVEYVQPSDNFSKRSWSSVVKNGTKVNNDAMNTREVGQSKSKPVEISEKALPSMDIAADLVQGLLDKVVPCIIKAVQTAVTSVFEKLFPSLLCRATAGEMGGDLSKATGATSLEKTLQHSIEASLRDALCTLSCNQGVKTSKRDRPPGGS